jgi:hypothetical protein
MQLLIEDLNDFGRARLEDDYHAVERRDGGKTSRQDFAFGWMALAVRHKLWSYFTNDTRELLTLGCQKVSDGVGWHWEHTRACAVNER